MLKASAKAETREKQKGITRRWKRKRWEVLPTHRDDLPGSTPRRTKPGVEVSTGILTCPLVANPL